VFTVSKSVEPEDETLTVLPTGSHVKARVVSGVEANAREPYPVLLQLDYAFTGPNKTRIDLSQCFMIAKARANMSTERVMMETESLSCVRDDGEHFKREAKGFVAGSDNTFGATGTYISKQSQVLLSAVLASIAKNAGQAIADAEKTTSIFGTDKAATAANVTGNKAAFIGGSALVDGAGMVAQWYLEQAKELLPSIGVGSGQDVFVVMLDSIKIPQLNTQE
jgi:conjugal transfer pilus assembly protein TraB